MHERRKRHVFASCCPLLFTLSDLVWCSPIVCLFIHQSKNTALQKKIGTDIIEIKDLKNNPGKLTMKTDKKLNLVMETDIDPQTVNISKYSYLILGSPIWMGTLSPAIRKFLSLNKFEGKKVAIFTTTNAHENEKMQEKNKNLVKQSDGEVIGYYQVLAMEEKDGKKVERSIEQIVEDALKFAPEIQKVFSASPLAIARYATAVLSQ